MNSYVKRAPLTDEVIISISQLIDDAQVTAKREPSHSDLEFYVNQVKLNDFDPRQSGRTVGKAKRIRERLYGAWNTKCKREKNLY